MNWRQGTSIWTVALILIVLMAAPSYSQDAATATASATVQQALAVSASNSLLFRQVLQGIASTMPNSNDDSTAQFAVTGQASSGVNLQLTLPEYLSTTGDRMTITFSNTDAVVDTDNTSPSTVVGTDGWIDQNPRTLPAGAVIGSGGQTNIYLGGTVTPSTFQTAGTYTGDIILSVAYNGN